MPKEINSVVIFQVQVNIKARTLQEYEKKRDSIIRKLAKQFDANVCLECEEGEEELPDLEGEYA